MRARGFSLVECLVAAVLLAAGLLAIVASQRAMQRLELDGRRTAEAAEAATARFALLRGAACGGAAGGNAPGVISEAWSVTGGPLARVTVAVTFDAGAGPRTSRYDSAVSCVSAP